MNVRSPLHSLGLFGALLGCSAVGYAAPHAAVGGPAPGSSGSIVITDHQLNPALYNFQKELKSEAKTSLDKNPDSDTWKMHFIAYLNHAAASEDVNIVFYDPLPPKAGQPREPIQAYPIRTKSNAKIVISQLDLKPEEGFKPGGKYQVLLTRLVNGKEDVYARGSIQLTDKAAVKEAPKEAAKDAAKDAAKEESKAAAK